MKDEVFGRFWPLTSSLDLVRGHLEPVADALAAEISRTMGSPARTQWLQVAAVEAIFSSVKQLANIPTQLFVLPARNGWSVLWNNSLACDGYDSLCHNLTRLYGFDTLAWQSSDKDGPQQAGTRFSWRPAAQKGQVARTVYCCRNDRRWTFEAHGTPLPGEPAYDERQVKRRLDEERFMEFLAHQGAEPWRERFYDLSRPVFRAERTQVPATILFKPV